MKNVVQTTQHHQSLSMHTFATQGIKKRKKLKKNKVPKIQRVYEAAHTFFSLRQEYNSIDKLTSQQSIKLQQAFDKLYNLVNSLQLEDIGIQKPSNDEKLEYSFTTIYESDLFVIWLFIIPKHCQLPLHDHPKLTVLSKFLYGKVRMQNMDIECTVRNKVHKAKVNFDGVLSENALTVISDEFPAVKYNRGNIHSLYAIESFAFLDVSGPCLFDEEGNTNVKYYKMISEVDNNKNCLLEETPDTNIPFRILEYQGPKLRHI